MGLIPFPSQGRIFLDTSPIIYSVEKVEPYRALMLPIWQAANDDRIKLFGSQLLLLEVLVKPLRSNNVQMVHLFRELLASHDINLLSVSADVLERGALLRAASSLRTPDSIHLATAIEHDADLFITNDKKLRNAASLDVIVLADYL